MIYKLCYIILYFKYVYMWIFEYLTNFYLIYILINFIFFLYINLKTYI